MLDFSTYQSPFSWRYGSQEMRRIWSEESKHLLWRRIWVAVAQAQAEMGLVSLEQVQDLQAHAEQIDLPHTLELEAELRHDVMAALKTFAGQCALGGGILHLGLTSMDVVDNADVLRMQDSLDLILARLKAALLVLAELISRWADTPIMAFTHLQPAEPSSLGYRLAFYGQDLLADYRDLSRLRREMKGKGIKGSVGTSASFVDLLGLESIDRFEARLSELLGLAFFPVTSQVYPRKQDYRLLSALAGLGAGLHKFAFDLRLLQSPPFGELAEPFGARQVGSSAMPFKRNPIHAEKIDSLARLLAALPRVAWDNAALSLLERTLDDSANRRSTVPEAFLLADELLGTIESILRGLDVNSSVIQKTLAQYAPFAALEAVLMAVCKAGADRHVMHEVLRENALQAWSDLQHSRSNPLPQSIPVDQTLRKYLSEADLRSLMSQATRMGAAPKRARSLAECIEQTFSSGVGSA